MRLPLMWRPAPDTDVGAGVVNGPVGQFVEDLYDSLPAEVRTLEVEAPV